MNFYGQTGKRYVFHVDLDGETYSNLQIGWNGFIIMSWPP